MVKEAGIMMPLYKRCIDDSDQLGRVPPEGSRYDAITKRIVNNEEEADLRRGEAKDSRLARVLREIANDVQVGIELEEDHPSAHENGMMPILDMNVWVNEEGVIMYKHYEKEVSSRKVMHANSAQSASCKKSVHVQEVLRRVMNTSTRLDWNVEVAPVLTDYMGRMLTAGYSEGYRKNVLMHAFKILDRKEKEVQDGVRPMFRKKEWEADRRRINNRRKKNSWSTQGDTLPPLWFPQLQEVSWRIC